MVLFAKKFLNVNKIQQQVDLLTLVYPILAILCSVSPSLPLAVTTR